jgi:ABC-type antimicrobial peptide transport system permease subunit
MTNLLVIGVARDMQSSSVLDGMARACVYVPLQQQYSSRMTLVVRTTQGQRIADELRKLVASMDPHLSIMSAQTLQASITLGLAPQRALASVSGCLGIVGMMLAGIGIYGATAYSAARRTREIGVRAALGARPTDIITLILWEGLSLTLVGSVVGLMVAAGLSQALAAFLFGIPPIDPVTLAATTALFATIGLAACYGPVRRATRVDVVRAIRCE